MRKSRSRRKTRRGGAVTQAICDTAQKAQDEAIRSGKEIAWKADVDGLKLLSFDTCNAYTGNKTDPKCLKFRDDLAKKDPVFCRGYLKKQGETPTKAKQEAAYFAPTPAQSTEYTDAMAKTLADHALNAPTPVVEGSPEETNLIIKAAEYLSSDPYKNDSVPTIAQATKVLQQDPAFKNVSDVKKLVSKANAVCKKEGFKIGPGPKGCGVQLLSYTRTDCNTPAGCKWIKKGGGTRKNMRRKTARKAYSKKRGGAMLLRCQEGVQRAMGPWACGTAQFGGRKSRRGGTHCSPKSGKKCPYYQKYGYHKY